jgi:hypothetical protein
MGLVLVCPVNSISPVVVDDFHRAMLQPLACESRRADALPCPLETRESSVASGACRFGLAFYAAFVLECAEPMQSLVVGVQYI